MNLVEVKTSELAGAALDWAVAKCEGYQPLIMPIGRVEYAVGVTNIDDSGKVSGFACNYSTDWSQGGPLIERYKLHLNCHEPSASLLQSGMRIGYMANTVLIAAMRAIVAAKLGDVVNVPLELVECAK